MGFHTINRRQGPVWVCRTTPAIRAIFDAADRDKTAQREAKLICSSCPALNLCSAERDSIVITPAKPDRRHVMNRMIWAGVLVTARRAAAGPTPDLLVAA